MQQTIRGAKAALLVFAFALFSPLAAQAADYYVDQNNPAANDSNPGTEAQPWQTITKANQAVAAGDTVHIKAGTYSSYIAPDNSGTTAKLITYTNYGSDSVIISNASYGIFLDGKSYIVVDGISFTNLDGFLWLQNSANHNTIANCSFKYGRNISWSGSKIYKSSSYNWVHNCTFSDYGYYGASSSAPNNIGTVLDIGNEYDSADMSQYNLIEKNSMYHGGHHVIGIMGMYNVVRNNYFHNEVWNNGHGDRVVYLQGYAQNSGRNLIEGNRIAYSSLPPDQWGSPGMSLDSSSNIVRFNSFYNNNLAGISLTTSSGYTGSPSYNKIYNNTIFHGDLDTDPNAGQEMMAAIAFTNYGYPGSIANNAVKNNILWMNKTPYGIYGASLSDQIFAANWEEGGDPLFVNGTTNSDPGNAGLPDLHLQPGSPCIDKGTYLAKITSASGSGTTFQVDDAGYFTDGWGIIEGDTIQLFGTTQRARITSVNYQTNTITVNSPVSWTQNQGVSMSYQGSAPDIGAYEYNGKDPSAPKTLRVK